MPDLRWKDDGSYEMDCVGGRLGEDRCFVATRESLLLKLDDRKRADRSAPLWFDLFDDYINLLDYGLHVDLLDVICKFQN